MAKYAGGISVDCTKNQSKVSFYTPKTKSGCFHLLKTETTPDGFETTQYLVSEDQNDPYKGLTFSKPTTINKDFTSIVCNGNSTAKRPDKILAGINNVTLEF